MKKVIGYVVTCTVFCLLSNCALKKNKTPTSNNQDDEYSETITIAAGGDWDDKWGKLGATELSLRNALHTTSFLCLEIYLIKELIMILNIILIMQ